jgi:oligosaccharide repeat unit polymerase
LTGFFKSTDPRVIVGSTTLGYAHSTTSMIFGPALLDFGLSAMLIQMFLLGVIMNFIYRVQRALGNIFVALYAILLAHVLIWIETGPTDLVVLMFFFITLILIGISVKIKKGGV